MSPFVIIAYAGIGISALILAGFAGAQIQKFADQVKRMEERIVELADALKESKKNRNPVNTNIGIEDINAISMDQLMQIQLTLQYVEARTKQIAEIARIIRKNPDDYDPDKPNKKRPL